MLTKNLDAESSGQYQWVILHLGNRIGHKIGPEHSTRVQAEQWMSKQNNLFEVFFVNLTGKKPIGYIDVAIPKGLDTV